MNIIMLTFTSEVIHRATSPTLENIHVLKVIFLSPIVSKNELNETARQDLAELISGREIENGVFMKVLILEA